MDLLESMKEQMNKTIRRELEHLKQDWKQELKEMEVYEKEFSTYLWMRILQDHVYFKMSNALDVSDPKEWPSFENLVTEYENTFDVDILTKTDLDHLRAATDRTKANGLVYPDLTDFKATQLSWRALYARLEEEGKEEEQGRYRRYYQFAIGDVE
jgi:hypothetical protein